MKTEGLDERERLQESKAGRFSFYVMFIVSAAVILLKLIRGGNFESVWGETVILAAGAAVYLQGAVKNGIWSGSGKEMTVRKMILGSVICSGIFSVFFAFIISGKVSDAADITTYVLFFFLAITVLCYVCMAAINKIARSKKEKLEKKYSE